MENAGHLGAWVQAAEPPIRDGLGGGEPPEALSCDEAAWKLALTLVSVTGVGGGRFSPINHIVHH